MKDEITIGARLRALRRWRGMTLVELAGLAGLSPSFLSMAERGQRAIDRRSHIAAIAAALQVSETELTGGPHLTADRVQSDSHLAVPALRVAFQTNSLYQSATDRARPVGDLAALVAGPLNQWRLTDDYTSSGGMLPDVIDELYLHAADPADELTQRRAMETLVEATHQAAIVLKNLHYPDLAYLAALRCMDVARTLDDPVAIGQASFPFIMNAPHEGSWRRVVAMAERAANDLEPHAKDQLGFQVLGMLTLSAALAAAAVPDVDRALHWLDAADELASRVPDEPTKTWQAFSATNAMAWRVDVGVEFGQSGGEVLAASRDFDLAKFDGLPFRRAGFMSSVGRGLARDPKTRELALEWLSGAEKAAPQRIRNNLRVRESVAVMLEQARTAAVGRELRGMMARMGIPH